MDPTLFFLVAVQPTSCLVWRLGSSHDFVWLEVSISWVWRLGSLLLTFSPVRIAARSDSPTAALHPARHCPMIPQPPQLSNSLSAHTATWNLCPLVLPLGLPTIPHADGAPCSRHELSHDPMLPPRLPSLSVLPMWPLPSVRLATTSLPLACAIAFNWSAPMLAAGVLCIACVRRQCVKRSGLC
jgi:hypothetical protein